MTGSHSVMRRGQLTFSFQLVIDKKSPTRNYTGDVHAVARNPEVPFNAMAARPSGGPEFYATTKLHSEPS